MESVVLGNFLCQLFNTNSSHRTLRRKPGRALRAEIDALPPLPPAATKATPESSKTTATQARRGARCARWARAMANWGD